MQPAPPLSSRDNPCWSHVPLNPNLCSHVPVILLPLSMQWASTRVLSPVVPSSLPILHPYNPCHLAWPGRAAHAWTWEPRKSWYSSISHTHPRPLRGTHRAVAFSLSGSRWTGWMTFNKGGILNFEVLIFQVHSDLGSYCLSKVRCAFSIKVWWRQSRNRKTPLQGPLPYTRT